MNKVQISVAAAILVVGTAGIVAESRENQRLQREFDTALTEAAAPSLRPGADVPPAHDTQSTAELARLHDRIAELRARPDGVVDAEIVPPTEWRNRGWATPEAAFETLYWAITRHQFDVLGRSYIFGDKAKAQADAAFASLPADLQARYGTPERLFAPFVFGGGEGGRIDATQVIDVNPGDQDNEANLRFWLHFKDGSSRVETLPFQRVGDKWLMGSHAMGFVLPALTPEFVQKISAPGAAPDAATPTP